MAVRVAGKKQLARVIYESIPDKAALKKQIMESLESSPELRKEIRRVFHMANRRIENIQRAGVLSPALLASNKSSEGRFSKFSISSLSSWQQIKEEYGRCLAFLNSQTSTVRGCRNYKKAIQSQMGLQNEPTFFESLYRDMVNQLVKGQMADYAYWDSDQAMKMIHEYIDDTRNTLEAQSKEAARQLESDIEKSAQSFFDNLRDGKVV